MALRDEQEINIARANRPSAIARDLKPEPEEQRRKRERSVASVLKTQPAAIGVPAVDQAVPDLGPGVQPAPEVDLTGIGAQQPAGIGEARLGLRGQQDPQGLPTTIGAPSQEELAAAEQIPGTSLSQLRTPGAGLENAFDQTVLGPGGEVLGRATGQNLPSREEVEAGLEGILGRQETRIANIQRMQEEAAQPRLSPTQQRIAELESRLEQPDFETAETFGDLLLARRNRNNIQRQLDQLYSQQKVETQQAGQSARAAATAGRTQANADRNFQLSLAKFQAGRQDKDAASQRKAYDDMRQVATDYAKAQYKDDPNKQQAYVAKQLETAMPGFFLDTPEGVGYTRQLKKRLIDEVRGERGLFDWMRSIFGGSTEPSQADIESMSFKGWKIGDSGPFWSLGLADDETVAKKDAAGNYAYLDNLSDEEVFMLEQLIRRDNPEDYPNVAQSRSVRGGQ